MFRYNLYVFDREGGLIVEYHPFEAAGPEAAIRRAEDVNAHRPMELWRDEDLMRRWPLRSSGCACPNGCPCPA